jgi:hypothetical protein
MLSHRFICTLIPVSKISDFRLNWKMGNMGNFSYKTTYFIQRCWVFGRGLLYKNLVYSGQNKFCRIDSHRYVSLLTFYQNILRMIIRSFYSKDQKKKNKRQTMLEKILHRKCFSRQTYKTG